jgi:hypothetical protein
MIFYMKTTFRVGMWYFVFVFLAAGLLWFLPAPLRVHPALAKPSITFLKKDSPPSDLSICLVGDCAVDASPWPYIKVSVHRSGSAGIIPAFQKKLLPAETKTFVVMNGTYLAAVGNSPEQIREDSEKIRAAILERFPDARVHIIPINAVRDIVRGGGGQDLWHMNRTGYRILFRQYYHFFTPSGTLDASDT